MLMDTAVPPSLLHTSPGEAVAITMLLTAAIGSWLLGAAVKGAKTPQLLPTSPNDAEPSLLWHDATPVPVLLLVLLSNVTGVHSVQR